MARTRCVKRLKMFDDDNDDDDDDDDDNDEEPSCYLK